MSKFHICNLSSLFALYSAYSRINRGNSQVIDMLSETNGRGFSGVASLTRARGKIFFQRPPGENLISAFVKYIRKLIIRGNIYLNLYFHFLALVPRQKRGVEFRRKFPHLKVFRRSCPIVDRKYVKKIFRCFNSLNERQQLANETEIVRSI